MGVASWMRARSLPWVGAVAVEAGFDDDLGDDVGGGEKTMALAPRPKVTPWRRGWQGRIR